MDPSVIEFTIPINNFDKSGGSKKNMENNKIININNNTSRDLQHKSPLYSNNDNPLNDHNKNNNNVKALTENDPLPNQPNLDYNDYDWTKNNNLNESNSLNSKENKSLGELIFLICLGQLLALLITGTGVFSQLLAQREIFIPTSQSFLNYFFLSFLIIGVYQRYLNRKKKFQEKCLKIHQTKNFQSAQNISEPEVRLIDNANDNHNPNGANAESFLYQANSNKILHSKPSLSLTEPFNFPSSEKEKEKDYNNDDHHSADSESESGVPDSDDTSTVNFLDVPWYIYLLLAIADVEGNYLLVSAYEYTSITSVQLLDCATIPLVMIFSRLLYSTRYTYRHIIGALTCVCGLGLLLVSDFLSNRNEGSTEHGIKGDLLVLGGCIFYAISNIGQEHLVNKFDRIEYLAMIGIFGSLISFIQLMIVERNSLAKLDLSDGTSWAFLLGFSVCLFSLYLLVPFFLQKASAVFMNLSFLTSDFWSILFAVVLFNNSFNGLYFIAFAVIIVGLLIYNVPNSLLKIFWIKLISFIQKVCSALNIKFNFANHSPANKNNNNTAYHHLPPSKIEEEHTHRVDTRDTEDNITN